MPNLAGMGIAVLVSLVLAGVPVWFACRRSPVGYDAPVDRPGRARWLWLVAPICLALAAIVGGLIAVEQPFRWAPRRAVHWMPYVILLGVAVALCERGWWRATPRTLGVLLSGLARYGVSVFAVYWLGRHKIVNGTWSGGEATAWLMLGGLALALVWIALEAVSHRREAGGPRSVFGALALTLMVGVSLIAAGASGQTPLASAGFTTGPELGFAFAVALAVVGFAIRPGSHSVHGSPAAGVAVGVGVLILAAWLGQALFLNRDMPLVTVVVLLAAPLALLVRWLPVVRRVNGLPGLALGLGLVAVVAVTAALPLLPSGDADEPGDTPSQSDLYRSLG